MQGEVLNIAGFREDVVNIHVFTKFCSDELTEVAEQGLPEGVLLQSLVVHLGRLGGERVVAAGETGGVSETIGGHIGSEVGKLWHRLHGCWNAQLLVAIIESRIFLSR